MHDSYLEEEHPTVPAYGVKYYIGKSVFGRSEDTLKFEWTFIENMIYSAHIYIRLMSFSTYTNISTWFVVQ